MVSRKNKQSDPHAQREAQKYDNPIQSREYILQHLKERGAPATHETLCQELGQTSAEGIEALRRRLIAMCRDGQLICNRRDAFLPIDTQLANDMAMKPPQEKFRQVDFGN